MSSPVARVATLCEQCGVYDDHPKVHLGVVTKHHDCLSYTEEQMVIESAPVAGKIIDAAKGGKHGAVLLKHIESLHKDA